MVLTRFGPGERKGTWTSSGKSSTQVFVPHPQKEMDKAKGQRDYEEKMIVSAWYNMVRTGTTQESHRT